MSHRGRRTLSCTVDDPLSPLYIIAILRPSRRAVSNLAELAQELGMICTMSLTLYPPTPTLRQDDPS